MTNKMTSQDKATAHLVHKALADGEKTSPAFGERIRHAHKTLVAKYGSNWRAKAGITQ